MRKASKRKVRLVRAPVTKELADQVRMGLHSAYVVLCTSYVSDETLEQLSEGFDMIGIAISGKPRFKDEVIALNSASLALRALAERGHPIAPTAFEREPIRHALGVVDELLPRLDVLTLFNSLNTARALHQKKKAGN